MRSPFDLFKEDRQKTVSTLHEHGIDFLKDEHFSGRLKLWLGDEESLENELFNIDTFSIRREQKWLLKQAVTMHMRIAGAGAAFGRGAEKKAVGQAYSKGVKKLLAAIDDLAFSDADPQAVIALGREYLREMESYIPGTMYDRDITPPKGIVIQSSQMPGFGGRSDSTLDDDIADALVKIKEDKWNQDHSKK